MNDYKLLSVVFVLFFAACGSQPLNPSLDRPAIITNSSENSHQLIVHAIANLLHGSRVTLAEDVLTQTDTLVVHRSLLAGRDLGTVDNFQLVINQGECFLIHQNTQNREIIVGLDCSALLSN